MMDTRLKALFEMAVANKASDIHVKENTVPKIRIHGDLVDVTNVGGGEFVPSREVIMSVLDDKQRQRVLQELELDFSIHMDSARFRGNVYFQREEMAGIFRVVPIEIPSMDSLGLPKMLYSFLGLKQGFVLITGPTGHGKSTTVAATLDEINKTNNCHIVTIEDPVEYVLTPKKANISQREVGTDTASFQAALKSCLRQDPNVVFVGEMRDLESMALALTIAETGHLVFSTLHTNSAAQTMDRIIDVFPEDAKGQVRIQVASVLTAVVSQRLVPTKSGGLVAAFELMMATPAVRNAIREGKNFMIDNMIQTSSDSGMFTLEYSLAQLVRQGVVDEQVALRYCLRPSELQNNLRSARLVT